jgi:hypothetical protein
MRTDNFPSFQVVPVAAAGAAVTDGIDFASVVFQDSVSSESGLIGIQSSSCSKAVQAPVSLLPWKLWDILRRVLLGDAVGHRNAFLDVQFGMLTCLL